MIEQIQKFIARRSYVHKCYVRLFDTTDGQEVLKDLFKRFKVFEPDGYKGTPEEQIFADGSREVVLAIARYANMSNDRIIRQMKEQVDNDDQDTFVT